METQMLTPTPGQDYPRTWNEFLDWFATEEACQAFLEKLIVTEGQLTALRVTHSMRQALDHGTRTVMLHQGQVVLDVSGDERARMDVPDLLAMFERTRGEKVSDDALLLG